VSGLSPKGEFRSAQHETKPMNMLDRFQMLIPQRLAREVVQ
jgi:hypothetical protein